jgi:hypothetical protein
MNNFYREYNINERTICEQLKLIKQIEMYYDILENECDILETKRNDIETMVVQSKRVLCVLTTLYVIIGMCVFALKCFH